MLNSYANTLINVQIFISIEFAIYKIYFEIEKGDNSDIFPEKESIKQFNIKGTMN